MGFAARLELPGIRVDWRTRGILHPGPAVDAAEFAAAGHSLFDGTFTWPLMVVRRSALAHNVAALAAFADRHGLALAPHGKTSMSPELFQAQLDAGAWGITAATAAQVVVLRSLGVPRVLLASEILDAGALRWLAGELDGFEFLCFADSVEGVRALDEAAGETPFRVLVELGHAGGRTGCRGRERLMEVVEAVQAARGVELAGVACYEGTQPDAGGVRAFLRELAAAAEAVAPHVEGRMVVSAGGSAWFDLVAEELAPLARPGGPGALVLLRSGAYIAHDEGFYRERTPYNRLPEGGLRPALEVWAQVISVPEPGLALVGMGKRDVPYDLDLPFPRAVRRGDRREPLDGVTVTRVQDQHTYVTGEGLRPGDLVAFGISHPCTAFDKWRVLPVVDDDDVVIDLITTCF
ncbi:alanine racemase [Microbispora sp. ATCC PTA-5024]|uniref:alanine racemase n=1 Tax=Microbispora sp. ATCC PTA-5024 TaxID=316330 RepID=UPI0003DD6C91|nr:alanine racemase [Microbispora sp. ATCC PTA-5024]ETK33674.1 hypothetical protein MPTA5024_23275 [Microbispora sp. ATCC PTA-5024]